MPCCSLSDVFRIYLGRLLFLPHVIANFFYAVEVHVTITVGTVGFDSDLNYSSTHAKGYVTVDPVFQVDQSFFVPHYGWQWQNQEYDRWFGDVEVLFAKPV